MLAALDDICRFLGIACLFHAERAEVVRRLSAQPLHHGRTLSTKPLDLLVPLVQEDVVSASRSFNQLDVTSSDEPWTIDWVEDLDDQHLVIIDNQ